MYAREIINKFFVGQVSRLVKNFNIWIYSGTINVNNVKLCMMVYLAIPLSAALAVFQGHSNVELFENSVFSSN